jgi:hypothetical protein
LSATEPQRLALHAAARAALGSEEGDTLMALTPPANTDIATQQGLEVLRSELLAHIERSANRTLRWCIGAIIATQTASVGLLTLLLR